MTMIGDMKRRLIIEAISEYMRTRGYQPTRRELAQELGYAGHSAIQHHLKVLERAGAITRDSHGRISINGAAGESGAGE
jgi:repressor LexA